MAGPKTRFYRDRGEGKVTGVCAGLAQHFGWNVNTVRVVALASPLLVGPFGAIAYVLTALVAPARTAEVNREISQLDRQEQQFWKQVRRNPKATARSVRARFRDLDRRLAHAEAFLTSPDARLAREIDRLR